MNDALHTQVVPLLISIIGGGTLVPLVYRIWSARKSSADTKRASAQVEEIAAHAAREAVEATRGALEILRAQLADGHSEIDALRAARKADREEIARLRARIRELTSG